MDLFQHHLQTATQADAPLAARMRPRTLDEFIGQAGIVGPGRLLRRAIQADQLSSLIFYGPPGTGKTTLAQIIANTTRAHFIAINAVLAGVKEIREAIALAQDRRSHYGQRTILFVDEVHRFNKSQQDALLPWVENGTVVLIGATTENPFFEVNKALVSRSRLFQLQSLDGAALERVVQQALQDRDRGYGYRDIAIEPEALAHLVNVANGDARTLLNALELAVETTPPDDHGTITLTLAVAEDSIQQRAVLYDKEGDAHFDTISAFIKSVRGSDPDAALYWLARMIYAGEDPRFIFRRLLILCSEDIGMADPQAIAVVNACAQAFDRVGLPEGRYPLAQATLYLATTAKSNSVMGFFDALAAVERARAEVPNPLKDANRDQQGLGHGAGYLYPHAYRDHWVEQQYLPTSLQGQVFYQPSSQGYEASVQTRVARLREAQLAALVEQSLDIAPVALTTGPTSKQQDRWLQRANQVGANLADLRDRLFAPLAIARSSCVLDLNAGSGLLTWEALRRVPEGGVFSCCNEVDAKALAEQAQALPALARPIVFSAALDQLGAGLTALDPQLRFDWIIGRNTLTRLPDKTSFIQQLLPWLMPQGQIVLGEVLPQQAQRLYNLLPQTTVPKSLWNQWRKAEEAIYQNPTDPMVNWAIADLHASLQQQLPDSKITVEVIQQTQVMPLTPALLERWFGPGTGGQASYGERLADTLSAKAIAQIQQQFQAAINQPVQWQTAIALLRLHK
jgi:putative ATPase